ncbi:MAG: hypothetical protein U9Q75_00405 [Pseudomonadota bacterium]|nr:hypothetical protein [Pseudomonadota bacterium]
MARDNTAATDQLTVNLSGNIAIRVSVAEDIGVIQAWIPAFIGGPAYEYVQL